MRNSFLFSTVSLNSSISILPLPTISKVPTVFRIMPRKKRLDVTVKRHASPLFISCDAASGKLLSAASKGF